MVSQIQNTRDGNKAADKSHLGKGGYFGPRFEGTWLKGAQFEGAQFEGTWFEGAPIILAG